MILKRRTPGLSSPLKMQLIGKKSKKEKTYKTRKYNEIEESSEEEEDDVEMDLKDSVFQRGALEKMFSGKRMKTDERPRSKSKISDNYEDEMDEDQNYFDYEVNLPSIKCQKKKTFLRCLASKKGISEYENSDQRLF